MNIILGIGKVLATAWLGLGMLFNPATYSPQQNFGTSFTPVQTQKTILAGAGIGLSDSSIVLQSLKLPDGTVITMANFGDIGYATIEPGASKEEQISFTGITQNANQTATLTGVSRGLAFVSPYAPTASLQRSHAGGSTLIITNTAAFYSQFAALKNNATVTGQWTFTTSSPPILNSSSSADVTNPAQFTTKAYVDNSVISGGVPADNISPGISRIATPTNLAQGTANSGAYAYVAPSTAFNSTSSATTTVPVTKTNGKLSQGFLDLTEPFTFSGGVTSTGATNLSTTTIQGYRISTSTSFSKFGGNGKDGALVATSTVINLGGVGVFEKDFSSITVSGTSSISFSNPSATGTVVILKSQGACNITTSSSTAIDASGLGSVGGTGTFYAGNGYGNGNAGSSGITDLITTNPGGAGIGNSSSAGGAKGTFSWTAFSGKYQKYLDLFVGAGGGSGAIYAYSPDSGSGTSGVGGRGGGALIMECGSWNFSSSVISVAGQSGYSGTTTLHATAGGGGGGSGGFFVALYNSLVSNAGTVNISQGYGAASTVSGAAAAIYGGSGGGNSLGAGVNGTNPAGASKSGGDGYTGFSYVGLNTEF